MLKILLCLFGLLFVVQQLVFAQTGDNLIVDYGRCKAPNNENGTCLRIGDCTHLYNLLNSTNLSGAEKTLLKQSQCGLDNTQTELSHRVLVCCPDKFCKDRINEEPSDKSMAGNVIPRAGICGKVLTNRIYGGNLTLLDEFPWMALIRYLKPNDELGFHCGGTLINHRYVLTAAHCVQNANVPSAWTVHSVRFGEWNLDTEPDCEIGKNGNKDCAPPHVDVLVEKAFAHELYISDSLDQFNDIALIRLKESVAFSDFIKPICLPISFDVRNSKFEDTVMDISGWGATERADYSPIKLKTTVTIWNLKKCQEKYLQYQISINDSQLCAGGKQGIDTCRGDSGGPLMVSERTGMRDIYYIAGIVSYGPKPCGLSGWPGVYTRVGNFIDWLQKNLKA